MKIRRLIAFVTLAVAGLAVAGAHAAQPNSGSVRPPSGYGLGPKITWQGESYPLAANTSFTCSDTEPCDIFHLTVPVPKAFWDGKGGGVTVGLSGYDENQDFDMRIFEENPDGTAGKRVGQSARAAGVFEKATIANPSGKYMVVVYPFSVVNSSYVGEAFFDVKPPRPPVPVVTDPPGLDVVRASHDEFNSHSEPSIAMNPLDHDNLVAASKMYTNLPGYRFKVGTYYSTDGGRTWKDNGRLPGYPNDEEDYITSDPAVTFDDEGNAYLFVLDSGLEWSGMNVHISRDGGKTWSEPIVVHRYDYTMTDADGFASIFDDKNWIVVDNTGADGDGTVGTVYTCWNADVIASTPATAVFYGQIVVSRSTDGGATWNAVPIPIHGPANPTPIVPFGDDVIGCQTVVAPDGTLYVFWADYGNNEIRFVKSTDHGMTFTLPDAVASMDPPPALPNTQFRNPIFPSVGIGSDGTITVVWGSDRFSEGDADIVVSRSTDAGATWSAPLRVNDDKGHASQFQPWIAVTDSGQANVFFFDRRHDPRNTYIDSYMARSSDGVHWTNVRVTPRMWDPFINPPISGSGHFIGDYQGIVADDDVAIPFWQDTSSGQWQEVFSARVPNTKRYGGPKPDTTVLGNQTRRPAPVRRALPATGVGGQAAGLVLVAGAFGVAWLMRERRTA